MKLTVWSPPPPPLLSNSLTVAFHARTRRRWIPARERLQLSELHMSQCAEASHAGSCPHYSPSFVTISPPVAALFFTPSSSFTGIPCNRNEREHATSRAGLHEQMSVCVSTDLIQQTFSLSGNPPSGLSEKTGSSPWCLFALFSFLPTLEVDVQPEWPEHSPGFTRCSSSRSRSRRV